MFGFWKNKGAVIGEEESPTKKQTSSPTKQKEGPKLLDRDGIYIEQIQNYIDTEQGYDVLRGKLIKQINTNHLYDSHLVKRIVLMLKRNIQSENRQKTQRTIYIIEDLLSHCSNVFNQAMNERYFCEALQAAVMRKKLITLHMNSWAEIKERICGLFLYWFEKFKTEEQQYFYVYVYKKLKSQYPGFPSQPFIKEVPFVDPEQPNQEAKEQEKVEITGQLDDAEATLNQGQNRLANGKMTTEYVRLMKAKSKILYQLSTNQKLSIEKAEKQRIKKLYKGLRVILKETQKKNEQVIKDKKIKSEQQYLAEKMSSLDQKKKSQKHTNDLLDMENTTHQEISSNSQEIENITQLQTREISSNSQEIDLMAEVKQINKQQSPQKMNLDLLDIGEEEKEGDLLNMGNQNKIDIQKMYEKAQEQEKPFGLENLDFANQEEEFTDFQEPPTNNDEII